jgi:hypothetical protein
MLLAQREALSTNPLNKELANSVEFAEKLKTRLQNARDGNLEDNESADKLIFLLDRAVIFTIKQVPIVIFETPVLEGTKSSPTLILPEVSQPLIEKKVKLPKTNDIIFIKGLIISEFPNDISSEHQMADKSPTNEKEDQEIRSVDLYMDEIAKYPLLNLEGEKILGEKIFKAKLSLRTLKSLTDYLPIEEQTKVNTLVSKGRGKIIFDVLLSEISGKKDSIEEKTKVGEVVPDDEIVFMEKVNENSQSIEQQAEGLLSIKDKTTQEQKALEFAMKEMRHLNNFAIQIYAWLFR